MDELAYYRDADSSKNNTAHNSVRSARAERPPTSETKRKPVSNINNDSSVKNNRDSISYTEKKNKASSATVTAAEMTAAANDFDTYNKYKYFAEPDTHVSRSSTKPTSHPQFNHHQLIQQQQLQQHQQQQLPVIDPRKLYSNYQQPVQLQPQGQPLEFSNNSQGDLESPLRKANSNPATANISQNNSHVKANIATINNRNKPLPTYSQLYQRGHSSFNINQQPTPITPPPAAMQTQYVKYDNNWPGDSTANAANLSSSSSATATTGSSAVTPPPPPQSQQPAFNPKPIQYPQQSYLGSSNPSSQFYTQNGTVNAYQQQPFVTGSAQQQQPHVHANRRIPNSFHFQQARSKSLDAHMFTDSPELG
jgi:hypothetical protein